MSIDKWKITLQDIYNCDPCYDPVKEGVLPENWEGTLLELLEIPHYNAVRLRMIKRDHLPTNEDKIWLLGHKELFDPSEIVNYLGIHYDANCTYPLKDSLDGLIRHLSLMHCISYYTIQFQLYEFIITMAKGILKEEMGKQ